MLLGTFEHHLDEKQRLTIPSKLRIKLGDLIYVSKGFDGCLEVRAAGEFDKWYNELQNDSNKNSDARLLSRQILANAADVTVDNAGRIKIPPNLLLQASIDKDVVILGLGTHLEIWDIQTYSDYLKKNETNLEAAANNLGGIK